MPTSSYMPDVSVEIAFGSGFRTPAASRSWTDVSSYVELKEGIEIAWGRQSERDAADANTLTLTLDNRDGRFTAERASSPYSPNVKLYVPIRVRATPVDGSISTRFMGYVNAWPVEWEGTDGYAKVTVSASSRLARLGLDAQWRSLIEEQYLYDNPVAYYPLGEPEGSTKAFDTSGLGKDPLVTSGSGADLTFGLATGPGTDGLTAATFVGGKYLAAATTITGSALTVEGFVLRSGNPGTDGEGLFSLDGGVQLRVSGAGVLSARNAGGGVVTGSVSVTDGVTHHVALTISAGGTWTLYVDGVSDGSAAGGAFSSASLFSVGSVATTDAVPPLPFSGVVAHAAVFVTALSGARIAAHATSGSTGFAGDLTSARLVRYAELVDIPAAEVSADTGSVTMTHVDTADQQVVDLMRVVERTEGGVLFDAKDGTLTFHNRSRRYTAATAFTLDFAEHEVEASYDPRLDAAYIVNDVTVTSPVAEAHRVNTTSVDAYGLVSSSVDIADQDDDGPNNYASWALAVYAEPRTRVPTLSVDALAQVGKTPNCAAVLAATVGTKVATSNNPSQDRASTGSYFIEGGTESYGPESLKLTWNVSPSSPDDTTLILSDGSRGFLGSNPLAF